MSELSVIAGLPVKVMVGDVTYYVSPMTLEDWAVVEAWAEEEFYNDMKKRIELVNDPEVTKLIKHRLATITKKELHLSSGQYLDYAEGTARRLHRMLLHKQPNSKLEDAKKLLGYKEMVRISLIMAGIDPDKIDEEEEEGGDEKKARPTEGD